MGFEPKEAAQPALIGALLYDASAPADLQFVPTVRATAAQTVSRLVADPEAPRLWAVAGRRNVLTPLRVEE